MVWLANLFGTIFIMAVLYAICIRCVRNVLRLYVTVIKIAYVRTLAVSKHDLKKGQLIYYYNTGIKVGSGSRMILRGNQYR